MNDEEIIKDFFREPLKGCKKIVLRINISSLKGLVEKNTDSPDDEEIVSNIHLFNTFVSSNNAILDAESSFLKNWKLKAINPFISKADLLKLLSEIDIFYDSNKLIIFESDSDFYYVIYHSDNLLTVTFYYLLENQDILNLKTDISKLKNSFNTTYQSEESKSLDIEYNSFLYPLLLKKYADVFKKQDFETKELFLEINRQFLEALSKNRKYQTVGIIALISLIMEHNLIKIYSNHNSGRPPEHHNLNSLNDDVVKKESVELQLNKNGDYSLIYKSNSKQPYKEHDKISLLIKAYCANIRNKVLHYQQSSSLNLFYTSVHAIKYLVNVLMEIEDHDDYL